MINNEKDLIPPPSENEIVSKLSRHFHDNIRTAVIIRNIKTFDNLIELLDAFDQAGPSNSNSGNNGYNGHNLYQNQRFRPNVDGESSHLNGNNFRGCNFVPNVNQNNFVLTPRYAERNTNYNYNRGPGSNDQNHRNDSRFSSTNVSRHEGRNYAPTSHVGANQAHVYDRRDYNAQTYDQRPHDRGFVQNGVYHRRENVNTQNTGATESTRSQIGQTGVRRGNLGNLGKSKYDR